MNILERAQAMLAKLESSSENILFSPVSLEMSLGLVSSGAFGETRDQLLEFLGHSDYAPVAKVLTGRVNQSTPVYSSVVNLANSVWVNRRYSINSGFLGVAESAYDAVVDSINVERPIESAELINAWCSEKTHGLISDVVNPDMIIPALALILCSSLYLKASWTTKWNVGAGTFVNHAGKYIDLPDMLYSTEKQYFETSNAVGFGKNYAGGIVFVGILPHAGVGISDIDLNAFIKSKSNDYDVEVCMPKLNYAFESKNIVESLKALGVDRIFDVDADLSGLVSGVGSVCVSDIIQKCRIALDENGTEAAAVTATYVMRTMAMLRERRKKQVYLNRPFYYMILDDVTSQVLFIGSVNTP